MVVSVSARQKGDYPGRKSGHLFYFLFLFFCILLDDFLDDFSLYFPLLFLSLFSSERCEANCQLLPPKSYPSFGPPLPAAGTEPANSGVTWRTLNELSDLTQQPRTPPPGISPVRLFFPLLVSPHITRPRVDLPKNCCGFTPNGF